ncbi:MAG: indolepyruvate oxidoreductase subunit beta family protein [Chloroflexi bacterium]|uniref:Indolepyruvate oxidoreductase subunit beta family protein n=1 Tax=Candidatus Chlorohelix allophototropha TaxID=3003348 RepID=A0A8T7LRI6_9CHLR|nr:indolepyruvate oxidoreductase subunit beta family protein [Chloroflexota bacterium]WJW66533.1 indolepyruvate oxidoreductase subunit beta family protein [Chloroflexota bacterium L227-S17]
MLQDVTQIERLRYKPTIQITTILVGAIGGQGGNVLVEWLFLAADLSGFRAQSVSLPGLSQRGGATSYYMEIASLPENNKIENPIAELEKAVFGQHPFPGMVDVLLGQELLELGRLVQQGYASKRTTVVANSQRFYTTSEKMPAFDGRYPTEKIVEAVAQMSGAYSIIDVPQIARQHGLGDLSSNALMLGALSVLPGVLPIPVEAYRNAIQQFGLAVEMNLKAFEVGRSYQIEELQREANATQAKPEPAQDPLPRSLAALPKPLFNANGAADSGEPVPAKPRRTINLIPVAHSSGNRAEKKDVAALIERHSNELPLKWKADFRALTAEIQAQFPEKLHWALIEAAYQCADYQNLAYARRYLKEVARVFKLDSETHAWKLTEAYARVLSMRTTYEDAVRVASLKIQHGRFSRIRQEMKVADGQVLVLTDYLKPDAPEIYGIFPNALVSPMLLLGKLTGIGTWAEKKYFTLQLHPQPNTFSGYLTFAFLTWFKPLRPVSHRANREWKQIGNFTRDVEKFALLDYELAMLVVESGRLVKGYGDTRRKMFEAHDRFVIKVLEVSIKVESKCKTGNEESAYPLTLALGKRALRLVAQDDRGSGWAEQLADWALGEFKNNTPIPEIIKGLEPKAKTLSTKA